MKSWSVFIEIGRWTAAALVAVPLTAMTALADPPVPAASAGALKLELNRAETTPAGCRLSFLAVNSTGKALQAPAYELVFFSPDGIIEQLTVFDFGAMPEGKTVVRQFDVPGLGCGAGRILLNGPVGCEAEDAAHCGAALELASRTALSFDK
ncbi:hypothetical protein GCM10011316_35350 [Roseibium aquae]|uniref:Tat pathway signal sequence domain protein n=1 Tax=Roseibium aquae TaxID=1323746 RepID=A0A916X3P1_9HYPH|nr:hypothetical protein [Roseibium aquae]GGB60246.1 hypothetical protein GCM10011316_35350 [Roseibium aquae]